MKTCLAPVEPDGCGRPQGKGRGGLCYAHYSRRLKGQSINEPIGRYGHHGVSVRDPLYGSWCNMKERCKSDYKRHDAYFDRGIAVCYEWLDFEPFMVWSVANGYAQGLSLERVDNDRGYSPDNCAWIPMAQQARNKRNNHWVVAFGEKRLIFDWAKDPRCVVIFQTLYDRIINLSWDPERAITTPPRRWTTSQS